VDVLGGCAAELETTSSRAASTRPITIDVTATKIPENSVFLDVAILSSKLPPYPNGRISDCSGPVTVAASRPT